MASGTIKAVASKADIDALNGNLANAQTAYSVTPTAATNVTIDTNATVKIGNIAFIAVKGHVSASISNGTLFSVNFGKQIAESGATFPIGIGSGAWDLDSVSYGYLRWLANGCEVVGTVANGKYFHVYVPVALVG